MALQPFATRYLAEPHHPMGTICVINQVPRSLEETQTDALRHPQITDLKIGSDQTKFSKDVALLIGCLQP